MYSCIRSGTACTLKFSGKHYGYVHASNIRSTRLTMPCISPNIATHSYIRTIDYGFSLPLPSASGFNYRWSGMRIVCLLNTHTYSHTGSSCDIYYIHAYCSLHTGRIFCTDILDLPYTDISQAM